MKKHLMPAFRYTLKDYCRSAGVFVGVIVLVMALSSNVSLSLWLSLHNLLWIN